jgi:tetratricopeptide (TPR) repeat protein
MEELCDELEWRRVRSSGQVVELSAWLASHPADPRSAEARRLRDELRAWEEVQQQDTVAGYRAYLGSGAGQTGQRVAGERATQRYWLGRVERDPGDAHALVQLAETCLLERACSLNQMESYYRRALERRPDDPQALLGLARIAYNRDDFETAEVLVEGSLRGDDECSEAHLYRGRLLARRGEYTPAIAEIDRAIELDDENLEAYFHRGVYRLRSVDCRAGAADFEIVLALAGGNESKYSREAERYLRDCR